MKINGLGNVNPFVNTKQVTNSSALEKPKLGKETDNMQVSGNAHLMQKLLQKAKELPDIREEKVQEIAARIDNGQFEIDNSVIARKMLGI